MKLLITPSQECIHDAAVSLMAANGAMLCLYSTYIIQRRLIALMYPASPADVSGASHTLADAEKLSSRQHVTNAFYMKVQSTNVVNAAKY